MFSLLDFVGFSQVFPKFSHVFPSSRFQRQPAVSLLPSPATPRSRPFRSGGRPTALQRRNVALLEDCLSFIGFLQGFIVAFIAGFLVAFLVFFGGCLTKVPFGEYCEAFSRLKQIQESMVKGWSSRNCH